LILDVLPISNGTTMSFYPSTGFLKLLARFRKNESSQEEKAAMDTWYASLDNPDLDASRNPDSAEKVWDRITARTSDELSENEMLPYRSAGRLRYFYYLGAASVLFVSGLIGYYAFRENPNYQETVIGTLIERPTIVKNTTQQSKEVVLPDGSKVVLEPTASLRYNDTFNKSKRTVRLNGNAFFSVVKNKNLPFIVLTDVITTRVLGTEFTIKKNATSGETEVEVLSGRVEVNIGRKQNSRSTNQAEHVFLTANLKATFQPAKNELVTGLVAQPKFAREHAANPTQKLFIFHDALLKDVVRDLEEAYGVAINVTNEQALTCPITADLSGEPLQTQLDMIVTALNAEFSVNQAGVTIKGGGCSSTISRPSK
jgi:transmembrane sensor